MVLRDTGCGASAFAMPKSSTLIWPAEVRNTFAGLRSRWTMPSSCARIERAGHRQHQLDDARRRQPRRRLDELAERLAVEELEHHVRRAVVLVGRVDDHDVLVVALRGRARLRQEAVGDLARAREHELDRDAPAKPGVARGEHDAHAAAPELADQLVVTDRRAGHEPGAGRLRRGRGRAVVDGGRRDGERAEPRRIRAPIGRHVFKLTRVLSVRGAGLEPACPCGQGFLRPPCKTKFHHPRATTTLVVTTSMRRLQAVTVRAQDPEVLDPVVVVVPVEMIELERVRLRRAVRDQDLGQGSRWPSGSRRPSTGGPF